MFGNCCGRKKSKRKETKDAETQSEYEIFDEKLEKFDNTVEKVPLNEDEDKIEKTNEESDQSLGCDDKKCDNQKGVVIVDQPHVASQETNETLQRDDENDKTKSDNAQENSTSLTNKKSTEINEANGIKDIKEKENPVKCLQKQAKIEGSIELSSDHDHHDQNQVQIKVNGHNCCPQDSVDSDTFDQIDDEVFEEGIGPPIKLAKNMGKPLAKGQIHVPLPNWLSEEDDLEETGGTQEPPATPIGKDELALRRHRFYSELLSAAQNATEHKVHFDPLGPSVANVDLPHSQELEQLVSRLENVTSRLENVCQPVQEILKLNSCASLQDFLDTPLETPLPPPAPDLIEDSPASTPVDQEEETVIFNEKATTKQYTMSVYGYQDVMQGPLAQFLAVSQQLGGDIAKHAAMVKIAFDTQLQYIILASESKQPSQAEINTLIQPTAKCIQEIQAFRESNRGSQYFNHLSAISESIPALGWVAVSPTPGPYVKEMNDAGQFYTNRVLKDWKERDKKHVDWVKAWVQTLTELQAFVKQYHTTGLVWSGKNAAPVGAPAGVPPPPGPPPPPAMCDLSALSLDPSQDRSALFDQINQGADITKGLKKVSSDMQTHKNPALRTGPAPFKVQGSAPASSVMPAPAVDKPPVFSREGKKWLIEYQKGNHNLLVDGAEMNNVVYLYKCTDSTVTVKGKINSITLDSCKKTSVVFDSLVACVEFINCQSVQMQVLHKVPTISIDKTDGCQMYLSNESLEAEIVSSKSSEMNVLVPKPNGDYAEYPIPEQYKTTVVPGGLSTIIVESKG